MQDVTLANAVAIHNGQPATTSLKIAEVFGKRHDMVLRAIRNIEAPADFSDRNFAVATYTDEQGKPRPMYHITRDGFTLLAMGFTGKAAMQFKVAYINAFNAMAQQLAAPAANLPAPSDNRLDDLTRQVEQLTSTVQKLLPAHTVVMRWQVMPNGFEPPAIETVREYCAARGNVVNADEFCRYYTRRNWTRGRNATPITDWQTVLQSWEERSTSRKAVAK